MKKKLGENIEASAEIRHSLGLSGSTSASTSRRMRSSRGRKQQPQKNARRMDEWVLSAGRIAGYNDVSGCGDK
jgi:hypothetical protein